MRVLLAVMLLLTLAGCGSPADTSSASVESESPRARTGALSVPLQPGWNPLAFQCSRVTSLQAGGALALASFASGQYRVSALSLAEVNAGAGPRRGFYVYASDVGSLTYEGEDDGQGRFADLVPGWNLLSTATDQPVTPQGSPLPAFFAGSTPIPAGSPLPPGQILWAFASAPGRVTWATPTPSPSPLPRAVRLELTPAELTLQRFTNRQLSVFAILADGSRLDVTGQVAWSSSVPSAGAVSSTGLVTALFPTTVTITAALQGLTATCSLEVTDRAQAGPLPSPSVAPRLIVSSFSNNSLWVFSSTATGNVAPDSITTASGGPRNVQVVASRDEVWVLSQNTKAINVFQLSAVLAGTNPAAVRSFSLGSASFAGGMFYDVAADRLYTGRDTSLLVYDGASALNGGTPTPSRTVTGFPGTSVLGLTLDPAGNRLFVCHGTGASIFDAASTLNGTYAALPKRTIVAGGTMIAPCYDRPRDRLYIGRSSGAGAIVYNSASTIDNPAAPDATLNHTLFTSGSVATVLLDAARDELYFVFTGNSNLAVFGNASSLAGTVNATPLRQLGGATTGLSNPLGVDFAP